MNRYFINNPKKDEKDIAQPKDTALGDIKEVDQRRHEVLDYMLLRMEPQEIADEMGIQLHTVENDIVHITKIGFRGRDEDLEEVRAEVVAKFRYSWTEGRRAFKKSQGEVEKRTVKYGEGGVGQVDETGDWKDGSKIEEEKIQTEEKAGDPKFLQVMNDSAEKMAKVTGAQKHKEVEINNNMQQNSVNILSPNRSQMPEEFDQFLEKPDDALTPDERRKQGLDEIEDEL